MAGALDPHDVARTLRAMALTVEAEVLGLPPEVVRWHPAEGEWCMLEALGHLIETERRAFAGRIRQILSMRGQAELQSWDPAGVARARHDCERDPAELVAEFLDLREAGARLVEELRPEELARGGLHPSVGLLTVGDLLHEWVHHDRNHVRQMFANVQAYVWPAMGNAQKFSG
jgi:hypothetical protein